MKLREASHYRVEGHNPHWNDPLFLLPMNATFKKMWGWQMAAFHKGKDERFFAVQAFCGSGKSILQIQLAIYDIVSSKYTQKQLIVVPQEHIHRGFVGDGDLNYLSVIQDTNEYQWSIQPEHNFCDGYDRVDGLREWLLTPATKLAKGFTGKTIGGLNAICSHSALIHAWKTLTDAEKRQAIRNLTLRIDEAHHIKHVFLDDEDLTDAERLAIDYEATELGRVCAYILNSSIDTCKLHLTTATMYRGDRKTILSSGVRSKFVEYNLDWLEHFKTLGIKSFYLQYEEYENNPIAQIIDRVKAEPKEKHYVVVPSTGSKWRDSVTLTWLLKELYKVYPKDRVLDLVTKETQKANKAKLLAEPKIRDKNNPSMYDVVVVCMLGREGTDWCPCSRIHNAAVESSITLAVQTAGRAFRRYDGKSVVKIYHYVKKFIMPKKGISKRELLSDRTNALLICMQFDDMNNTIIIPALPQQGGDEDNGNTTKTNTLTGVFGDQYENVKIDLIEGYEVLENKTEDELYDLADRICDQYGVTDNRDAVKDALVARLVRMAAVTPELRGIDVAWLRENGFDKIKLDNSIYFGDYEGDDWQIVRKLLQDNRERWMEMYEQVKSIGIANVKPTDECYRWLLSQRQQIKNMEKAHA